MSDARGMEIARPRGTSRRKTAWRLRFFEFCTVRFRKRNPNPLSRSGLHSAQEPGDPTLACDIHWFCTPAVTETSAIAEHSSTTGAQNPIDLRAFALQGVLSFQRACRVGGPTNRHGVMPNVTQQAAKFIHDFWPLDPWHLVEVVSSQLVAELIHASLRHGESSIGETRLRKRGCGECHRSLLRRRWRIVGNGSPFKKSCGSLR
jgi:hypothetical protein